MIRWMMHMPVNVRSRMIEYAKEALEVLEYPRGMDFSVVTPHDPPYTLDCSEEWLGSAIDKQIVPEVIVTHATEFATDRLQGRECHFSPFAQGCLDRNPIRKEFVMLQDPLRVFFPVSVTPLVMVFNPETVHGDELVHSWEDLLETHRSVLFPDRDKPLSRAAGAYLLKTYPDRFPDFERRVAYDGSPASVVKRVASGEYDMAMTNYSFASMVAGRRVAINKPKEGCILLPQVMVWKKGVEEDLIVLSDLMMQKKTQEYLMEQGIWPARSDIPPDETFSCSRQLDCWTGWDDYIEAVADFDAYQLPMGKASC